MPKPWRIPLTLSFLILLSQAFSLPSPVRNAATSAWVSGYQLAFPKLYLLFAPFCGVADRLTLLSFHQTLIAVGMILVVVLIALGWRGGLIALGGFMLFVAWGALIPRP